jgi:hypothetical protein
MRQWLFACFALIGLGCGGSVESDPSPLHKLCMDACAHVHAKNCYEAAAVDVASCDSECAGVSSLAGNACTDEQAEWYACRAKATITCGGPTGETPEAVECAPLEQAISMCDTPGTQCVRGPGSDDICFNFGLKSFYVCSDGAIAPPDCAQVTSNGFCCP